MADKIHCVRKTLRLMPSEAQELAKNAKEAGMNEAEYIRFAISKRPDSNPEIQTLIKKLINEVNHIGVNINQIAANNNSNLYKQSDKTQLVSYMRKLNDAVNEVVIALGNN